MDVDLAKLCHRDPEDLWAWLGPIRASTRGYLRTVSSVRWDFRWAFRREELIGGLEYIANHELLACNYDHPWIGLRLGKGETFHSWITINEDGRVEAH